MIIFHLLISVFVPLCVRSEMSDLKGKKMMAEDKKTNKQKVHETSQSFVFSKELTYIWKKHGKKMSKSM